MIVRCILLIFLGFLSSTIFAASDEEITPYKYDGTRISYKVPPSSRFKINRADLGAPDIIYYFSSPRKENYPIALLCGGSSTRGDVGSIIIFHRHLLKEFLDRGIGVLTVEQRGVDGDHVSIDEFMAHYTRSERLKDHQLIIEHLKLNPPKGWNKKFVLLGVSEGGPLVTRLTEVYPKDALATIDWSGTGDWPWQEELWTFTQKLLVENPVCPLHKVSLREDVVCLKGMSSRAAYETLIEKIRMNPTPDQEFLGMTYKYHADALHYPAPTYKMLKTPYLLVAGSLDPNIKSFDAFAEKAKKEGVPLTYLRVEGMDHYVRKRPDIVEASLRWLDEHLA